MFIVDRIIENIMICENMQTLEIIEFEKIDSVCEGDIIKIVDNKIVIDYDLTTERKNKIANKLKKLKIKK